jgi:Na+-transporting NADH:ubiquinone oxidoreductase subunit NqrC
MQNKIKKLLIIVINLILIVVSCLTVVSCSFKKLQNQHSVTIHKPNKQTPKILVQENNKINLTKKYFINPKLYDLRGYNGTFYEQESSPLIKNLTDAFLSNFVLTKPIQKLNEFKNYFLNYEKLKNFLQKPDQWIF